MDKWPGLRGTDLSWEVGEGPGQGQLEESRWAGYKEEAWQLRAGFK